MKRKYVALDCIAIVLLALIAVVAFTDILISPPLGLLVDPMLGFWSEGQYGKIEHEKTITDPSLSAPVVVVFDKYGIPHIYASNISDAYFAVGYIHARERLWQMDMLRRAAEGRLAEILGSDALELDIFIRTIGIPYYANLTLLELMRNETLREYYNYLVAYSRGVNKFISELNDRNMPLMFKLLNYKPEPWKPLDSIAFALLMAWDLTGAFDDLYFYEIASKMGYEKFEEIFPIFRPYTDNYTIVLEWPNETQTHYKASELEIDNTEVLKVASKILNTVVELQRVEMNMGIPGLITGSPTLVGVGSNNWAINGSRTKSGKPILCSDPHLAIDLPLYWYICHIVVPGKMNIFGVTFPVSPAVVIGFNDHIAWGLVNTQADVVDFYYYKVKDGKYLYKGEWRDFDERIEIINVRGQEPYKLVVKFTVHGPVLTPEITGFNITVAMRWTGHMATLNLVTLFKLNTARNYTDFVDALRYWNVPAQNFVYADIYGNIAIWCPGLFPIREEGAGRFPYNGSAGEGEWEAFVPFDELPHILNPPRCFVASANQRPYPRDYPYYLGTGWDPSYRARRIYQVLYDTYNATVEDMMNLQLDCYEVLASRIVPILIEEYEQNPFGDKLVKAAIEKLKNWDYTMDKSKVAPTIWYYWFNTYRDYIWLDEWKYYGIRTNYTWGYNPNNKWQPPLEYTEYITREMPTSSWFDNVSTPDITENRSYIMRKSFIDAINKIREDLGDNIENWKWERVNKLYAHHISEIPEFGRGPFPLSGGFDTVNSWGAGTFSGGAGWRMVVDFANFSNSRVIIAGGQSGHITSKHYDDLLQIYVNGGYIQPLLYTTHEKFLENQIEAVWTFKP